MRAPRLRTRISSALLSRWRDALTTNCPSRSGPASTVNAAASTGPCGFVASSNTRTIRSNGYRVPGSASAIRPVAARTFVDGDEPGEQPRRVPIQLLDVRKHVSRASPTVPAAWRHGHEPPPVARPDDGNDRAG